jgi:hypothetical protein
VMKANQHVTSIFEGKEQGKQESIIEYAWSCPYCSTMMTVSVDFHQTALGCMPEGRTLIISLHVSSLMLVCLVLFDVSSSWKATHVDVFDVWSNQRLYHEHQPSWVCGNMGTLTYRGVNEFDKETIHICCIYCFEHFT